MSFRPIKLLARASRASRHEIAVRARQFLFARGNEALALVGRSRFSSNGHLRSLGLARHQLAGWLTRRPRRFFLDASRADELRRRYPAEDKRRLLERADLVVSGRMYLLGHGYREYLTPDRWHRDVILGTVAPRRVYSRIRYLDVDEVGDSKHVWEPNRFGWVYCLGAAFVLTGDQRYASCFTGLTRDWFERNPYPLGINYCSALEMSLRAYAWVWALALFRDHLADDPVLLDRLLHGIWLTCRHVERNLSLYFAPNTHLLGEAFGLYACGAALPEFSEAGRWRAKGGDILAGEAGRQIHRDGTHRELSSCYHLYATDFYVQARLIADETGFPVTKEVTRTARRLARRLAELCPPDSVLPQFNDCDGGRLTWFCSHPLAAGPTLRAAGLPGRPAAGAEDRAERGYDLWMVPGNGAPALLDGGPGEGTRTADSLDSGIVAFRNPAGDYLLFRSGPFGYLDCGHSHDAPTSLVLYLAGRPFIVDCGVGHYTQSIATRDAFRGAAGKNILCLDGAGPSIPGGWFDWRRTTPADLLEVGYPAGGFCCRGGHQGFDDASGHPVKIIREVTLLDEGVVVIADRWEAAEAVRPVTALTLHPEVEPSTHPGSLRTPNGTVHFAAQQSAASSAPSTPVAAAVGRGRYSPAYGVVGQTATLHFDYRPCRVGSSIIVFSRRGRVTTTDRPGEFLLGHRSESERLLSVPFAARQPESG